MKTVHHGVTLFIILLISSQLAYSQSGVGIGTATPNQHTVLDVVATSNDKGVLIPRLTTTQRNNMSASLAASEVGLMVFDSDLNGFYFWSGTAWTAINVVQDLQLVGNILTITNNASPTDIDLSPFSGTNTDNQTLSLAGTIISITGGNTLDLSPLQDGVNDADADPNNELQTIDKAGSTVTLSNGGGSFTDAVNDADASPTNEIQTLAISGTTLAISGGNEITLPAVGFKAYTTNSTDMNPGTHHNFYTAETHDIGNNFDLGTGIFTAPVRGIYRLGGAIFMRSTALGALAFQILVNGTTVYQKFEFGVLSSNDFFYLDGFSTDHALNAGDQVIIQLVIPAGPETFLYFGGVAFSNIYGTLIVAY